MQRLVELGCRLIMSAKAFGENSDMPLDENAMDVLRALKTETTANDYQFKHQEHFDRFTNRERIDLFTRNRKIIHEITNKDEQQNVPDFDYDIHKPGSLQDLGFTCFVLSLWYSLLYDEAKVKKDGMDDKDDEAITALFVVDDEISRRSRETIGYWSARSERKISYARNQGANSHQAGQWNVDKATDILKKYGGIDGYDRLKRGEKKKIIDEIEKAVKAKDVRNIYKIFNKIRKSRKEN